MATAKKPAPKQDNDKRDIVAIVAAILIHKGAPTSAAIENAKHIVEQCNELTWYKHRL